MYHRVKLTLRARGGAAPLICQTDSNFPLQLLKPWPGSSSPMSALESRFFLPNDTTLLPALELPVLSPAEATGSCVRLHASLSLTSRGR